MLINNTPLAINEHPRINLCSIDIDEFTNAELEKQFQIKSQYPHLSYIEVKNEFSALSLLVDNAAVQNMIGYANTKPFKNEKDITNHWIDNLKDTTIGLEFEICPEQIKPKIEAASYALVLANSINRMLSKQDIQNIPMAIESLTQIANRECISKNNRQQILNYIKSIKY